MPFTSSTSEASNPSSSVRRTRLFFVCVPRSGSTALLKCLSFINGVEAWFEPYVLAKIAKQEYKAKTGKELPSVWSREHSSEFHEAAKYIQNMTKLPLVEGKKFAFSEVKRSMDNITSHIAIIKDMGNSFHDRLHYLPSVDSGFKYVFIIRDPQLSMLSYRKASFGTAVSLGLCDTKPVEDFDLHVDDPYYYSPGGNFKNAYVTWLHVQDNLDQDPLVIDCEDFMANPKPFLQKICQVGGLEFHDGLLKWDASTDIIKTWKNPGGVPKMLENSLGYFHRTAINSSCFHSSKKEKPPLSSTTKDIQSAVADGTEYYNEMYELRYKP